MVNANIGNTSKPTSPNPNPVPVKDPRNEKEVFGLKLKPLLAILGLTLFFVLAMAGVLISQRQRQLAGQSVAPTAPESKPAAQEIAAPPSPDPYACTLVFGVVEPSPSPSATPSATPSPTATPSATPSPTPSVSPSPSPSLTCNDSCTTNAECQTANSSYICYQGSCRLDENPINVNCETEEQYQARIDCNDACLANADCSNSNHICYEGTCRLEDNPTSATCSYPQTVVSQPELPAELPQSGSEDVVNWIKAGLGVLGIGVVLLLLL